MKSFTKEKALSIIVNCAKAYKEHLDGNDLLFILSDKHLNTSFFEVSFYAFNFLHLTGAKLSKDIKAIDFYENCLDGKVSIEDFELADDGTTELKLNVLPSIVNRNISAKMVSDYDGSNPKLYTEKLAGGSKACIGFVNSDMLQKFIPNTVLNVDIRNMSKSYLRIVATYRKNRNDEHYTELVYKAKNIDWSKITYPSEYSYIAIPE